MKLREKNHTFGVSVLGSRFKIDIQEKTRKVNRSSARSTLKRHFMETQDPVHQMYGDIDFTNIIPLQLKGRAILSVTNEASLKSNNRVFELMPGEEVVYENVDSIVNDQDKDQLAYPEEFMNKLTPTVMPSHKLRLKIGAVIVPLRNFLPAKGLCNGIGSQSRDYSPK